MNTKLSRIKNDIEQLSRFNSTPDCGLTRLSFTDEDRMAREYIKRQMTVAGLDVYEDAAGNILGRLKGRSSNLPAVMIGSHFDSVRNGGIFDGTAGVAAALEVARTIKDSNIELNYPVEFVAMVEEEGTRFGGTLLGSMAMAGKVSIDEIEDYVDGHGISIAQAMKEFGLDPYKIHEAARRPQDIKAFIELHIEQGPVLETLKKSIGIVQNIVGIEQMEIVIEGRPDHAGTTPMAMRADALNAAAAVISRISSFARDSGEGTVATVGMIDVFPKAMNIVPGRVKFTVDIRSRNSGCIRQVINKINESLKAVSLANSVSYKIVSKLSVESVRMSKPIMESLINNCKNLGFSMEIMTSGAGHDAMVMADIADTGMIFVPSKGGRSHCPEEWTDYDDLQKGAELLYAAVLDLAEIVVQPTSK